MGATWILGTGDMGEALVREDGVTGSVGRVCSIFVIFDLFDGVTWELNLRLSDGEGAVRKMARSESSEHREVAAWSGA